MATWFWSVALSAGDGGKLRWEVQLLKLTFPLIGDPVSFTQMNTVFNIVVKSASLLTLLTVWWSSCCAAPVAPGLHRSTTEELCSEHLSSGGTLPPETRPEGCEASDA